MGWGRRLYCLLVGHSPFPSGDVADVLNRVSRGIFPAPRRLRRSIDPKLEAICLKAMALRPEDRHADSPALAGEIEVWLAEVSYRSEQERALHEVKRSLARLSIERAQKPLQPGHAERGDALAGACPGEHPAGLAGYRASCPYEPQRLACAGRSWSNVRFRTEPRVHVVVFSPDGRMLATAGADQMVRLWDVAKGGLLSSPIRHERAIRAIAFSPDGRLVATASDDGAMRQWDAMTGGRVGDPSLHGAPVTAVCFSPDGTRIATASGRRFAFFGRPRRGVPIGKPAGHDGQVLAVAFHPDGTTAGSGGRRWRGAVSGDREREHFWERPYGTRRPSRL